MFIENLPRKCYTESAYAEVISCNKRNFTRSFTTRADSMTDIKLSVRQLVKRNGGKNCDQEKLIVM